jgi:CubicO group peptidase (beta-lactamase class C family)
MDGTEFLRSDELPAGVALGYLEAGGLRTNIFHLPVRGSGDGGIYTTARDISSFWRAFLGGEIVPEETARDMVQPRSESYGLGFWLDVPHRLVRLEGSDAGVSFYSIYDPVEDSVYTVISNTTEGAWPVARLLVEYAQKEA